MLLMAVFCVAGCTSDDDNESNDAFVDLGLPSGTLWATCNIGANTPEEYGDYFAWGETEPKTIYSWSTYKYCNGDGDQLTKYCPSADNGYNGFTDALTKLLPEDDAATVILGDEWCTPTRDQWLELWEHTSFKWTKQKGVKGMLFTADNGNDLFLPAAGGHNDGITYYNEGLYWSCELYILSNVSYLNFNSDYCSLKYGFRCDGYSVRPVRSSR